MKKSLSFICAMIFVLTAAGCGNTASTSSQTESSSSAASESSSSSETEETASEEVSSASEETQGEYHTIVDHAGNEVEVPYDIERIAVADIYPLPSVLSVFFDSAEKIVGMAPASMTAAQNSLLSELYPEIDVYKRQDGRDCLCYQRALSRLCRYPVDRGTQPGVVSAAV